MHSAITFANVFKRSWKIAISIFLNIKGKSETVYGGKKSRKKWEIDNFMLFFCNISLTIPEKERAPKCGVV